MSESSRSPDHRDDETGVPGFRSWRGVYVFVLVGFVGLVVLLTLFSRTFR